jgi:hypothetical protein
MATFDPKTSEMTRLNRRRIFRYEEGLRRATATRAVLEQPKDLTTLDGAARIWDPTGGTADHMVVQRSPRFHGGRSWHRRGCPTKETLVVDAGGDEILQAQIA